MRTQKIESKKSATKSVGKDFTGISDLGFGANNSTLELLMKKLRNSLKFLS